MNRSIIPFIVIACLGAQVTMAQPRASASYQVPVSSGVGSSDVGSSRASIGGNTASRSESTWQPAVRNTDYTVGSTSVDHSFRGQGVSNEYRDRENYSSNYSRVPAFNTGNTSPANMRTNNNGFNSFGVRRGGNEVGGARSFQTKTSYTHKCNDSTHSCNGNAGVCFGRVCAGNLLYRYRCGYLYGNMGSYPSDWLALNMQYADYAPYRSRLSALYDFLDGYIIYGSDTLFGTVALTNEGIFFGEEEIEYNVPYEDKMLRSVVVFDGRNNELYLTRITPENRYLARVLHEGRLTVYDNDYSFIDLGGIDFNQLKIAYDDKVPNPLVVLDNRVRIIKAVNKVYGSALRPADYNWYQLINYIGRLD